MSKNKKPRSLGEMIQESYNTYKKKFGEEGGQIYLEACDDNFNEIDKYQYQRQQRLGFPLESEVKPKELQEKAKQIKDLAKKCQAIDQIKRRRRNDERTQAKLQVELSKRGDEK